jgi:hypothetical protein
LNAVDIADPPHLWVDLGFDVREGTTWVGTVCHRLGLPGRGVVAWMLGEADGFGELPTIHDEQLSAPSVSPHPNGVLALDHVVVATPDLKRTIGAFESAGLALRRTRQAGTNVHPMTQAFFKLDDVVVEVVGSPTAAAPGHARFWGLTFSVGDLDATAQLLGPILRPIKAAVQPGRRIATLDRSFGSTVPMAFMSVKE